MQETINSNPVQDKLPRLLKPSEVAQILNISKSFAYRLMRRGDLATIHLGRAIRVRPSDLEDYLQSRIHSQNDNQPHKYINNQEIKHE